MAFSLRAFRRASAASVLILLGLSVPSAYAHRDPSGCSGSGVQIQLFPFRTTGVCTDAALTPCSFDTTDPNNPVPVGCPAGSTCNPTALVGVVSECETFLYNAVLSYSGGNTCAFGQGTFTLQTFELASDLEGNRLARCRAVLAGL